MVVTGTTDEAKAAQPIAPDAIAVAFHAGDTNKDGVLSQKEYKAMETAEGAGETCTATQLQQAADETQMYDDSFDDILEVPRMDLIAVELSKQPPDIADLYSRILFNLVMIVIFPNLMPLMPFVAATALTIQSNTEVWRLLQQFRRPVPRRKTSPMTWNKFLGVAVAMGLCLNWFISVVSLRIDWPGMDITSYKLRNLTSQKLAFMATAVSFCVFMVIALLVPSTTAVLDKKVKVEVRKVRRQTMPVMEATGMFGSSASSANVLRTIGLNAGVQHEN